ncbi:MAG: hypothetical protein ACYDBQ_06905 [Thermoplasmatota archaeon]
MTRDRLVSRRDGARWSAVLGVGLLFLVGPLAQFGGIALSLLLGGVVMTLYGLAGWAYWGWRLHRLADPWAYDPDLDGPRP